jgi:uncharacterized protein (DUF302 family)
MRQIITASLLAVLAQPALAEIERIESDAPAAQTMDALIAAVAEAGARVLGRVDHAEGARSAGLELPAAEVLVNPRLGTGAMHDDARAGRILPLRVLVHEDAGGRVWLSFEAPEEIVRDLDLAADAAGSGGPVRRAAEG